MGAVAVGRLILLALLLPFGNLVSDRESMKHSREKWKTVLKLSAGWQDVAVERR
jgi:hypothetical protein